ncbi:MAG TPA: hypothetical protein PK090_12330, partial [Smithellaceae bacterium]|nr:hypothetical protein [Smithellaceae bacterium]
PEDDLRSEASNLPARLYSKAFRLFIDFKPDRAGTYLLWIMPCGTYLWLRAANPLTRYEGIDMTSPV